MYKVTRLEQGIASTLPMLTIFIFSQSFVWQFSPLSPASFPHSHLDHPHQYT